MRRYRWKPLAWPGFEYLEIDEEQVGVRARGMAIGAWGETTAAVTYHVTLGPDWSFRGINLQALDGTRLRLRSDGQGNWSDGTGVSLPELEGCHDIDLSGSPFTNTLPIRRATFTPGEAQHFRMAFIALDSFMVMPHAQVYTRLDDRHFRYLSPESGFTTELTVDADGFVVSYPHLFERVED